jgi:hypothetical protein
MMEELYHAAVQLRTEAAQLLQKARLLHEEFHNQKKQAHPDEMSRKIKNHGRAIRRV